MGVNTMRDFNTESLDSIAYTYTEAVLAAKERIEAEQKMTEKDIRLHNTKLLLENYRKFVGYVDNATFKVDLVKDAEAVDWFKEMYDPNNRSDQIVTSIKSSAVKTRIIVEHIKTTVKVYGEYCDTIGTDKAERRFDVLFQRYISEKPMTNEELAEKWYVDARTIQTDAKEAIDEISSLLFGLDFLNT